MVSPCPLLLYWRRVSALQSAVCWTGDAGESVKSSVGSWAWFCHRQEMNVVNNSSIPLISSKHAAAVSAWERRLRWILAVFFKFFDGWRRNGSSSSSSSRHTGSTTDEPRPLDRCRRPGSVWRDAARPEDHVWSSYPGGGYVKTITSLYMSEKCWEITSTAVFLLLQEGRPVALSGSTVQ